MTSSAEWARIEAALDEILALPEDQWSAACTRVAGEDRAFRSELESLLANVHGDDPVLDFPAAGTPEAVPTPIPSVPAGSRIGAYRIVALLGRGGMGEVYSAERADGQFEQQVAIKLMRSGPFGRTQRFQIERQTLARLEHPNIAGLRDGGVTEDGRLFMVMDLVRGRPITQWCREQGCPLKHRLQLFSAVCDAVAYAHRKLIVHRDIKPNNVLVTDEGEVKLLDFGVARLLDQASAQDTLDGAMSPGYAAPEQLTGEPITTATDIYALGVLLFELLTGQNPWGQDALPLAALVGRVLNENVPAASRVAEKQKSPPVPPKALRGDLDAIIAKAMRTEPESRYESVAQMQKDIGSTLGSEPVSARADARWYVAGRFLKRHRWGFAAAAVVMVAVLGAAVGIAWQGHIAKQESARALAVKDFLVKVFRASDPRIASDKPREQITAKELLDESVGRIDQEFVGQPELRLELLGITMEIYGYLGDDERFEELMKKRTSLARSLYGDRNPIAIYGVIMDAWQAIYTQDYLKANRLLEQSDGLLRSADLDQSKLRAEWWLAKERALNATPGSARARRDALDRAIALFARYDPQSPSYPAALANAATIRNLEAAYAEAVQLDQRAIQVEEKLADRDDSDLAVIYSNYGDVLSKLGRLEDAGQAYSTSATLASRTEGVHFGTYWQTLGAHALLLYFSGDRAGATTMLDTMLAAIPPVWKANTDDTLARESYARFLTEDGRAAEAVPLLESALKVLTARPRHDYDLRETQLWLGNAYEAVGRTDDARQALQWSLHDFETNQPANRPGVLEARERWARFLLDHPRSEEDTAVAYANLKRVLADGAATSAYTVALVQAHADLARAALHGGQAAAALAEFEAAEHELSQVRCVHDVRIADDLELLHSSILAAMQRLPEAREAASLALKLAQRHDAGDSERVRRASAQLASLGQSVRS